MMKKLTILMCLCILLTTTLTPVYAKRGFRSWDNLIESAEFIAMASLTKIEVGQKSTVNFKILRIYKGERVENIELDTTLGRTEDGAWFNEVGAMYILFLEKDRTGYVYKYSLSDENFFKITHLREPNGNLLSVISEKSYSYLTGIPEELFTEREIRLGGYGKSFDFKARVMESFKVEQWLWKRFPADSTLPKATAESPRSKAEGIKEQFK